MKKLDKIRADIETAETEIARLDNAPLPPAEVEAMFRQEIERQMMGLGSKLALWRIRPDRDFAPPKIELNGALLANAIGVDAIVAAMMQLVDPAEGAVATEDRARLLTELRSRRRQLLADEEREVLKLEDETGQVLDRRAGIDADVVLEVWNDHDQEVSA